jgi:hypothetical protein
VSLAGSYIHITIFMKRHALIEDRSHQNSVVRNGSENRDFDIYRSPSGIPANQAGRWSVTTRPGPIENEHKLSPTTSVARSVHRMSYARGRGQLVTEIQPHAGSEG